jgi:hypothetical protein
MPDDDTTKRKQPLSLRQLRALVRMLKAEGVGEYRTPDLALAFSGPMVPLDAGAEEATDDETPGREMTDPGDRIRKHYAEKRKGQA